MQQYIQSVKGMHDILPDDHVYFTFLKKVIRHLCRQNGIKRITTPVLEHTELFKKGLGESTDIVEKEMYTFQDQGEEWLTLRPEGTAGIVRSYLEHGMHTLPQPVELYCIDPMFRRERPQKGRFRQHFQLSVEIIGESDPAIDAELINLLYSICSNVGLKDDIKVLINSLGTPASRTKYIAELRNFYMGKERNLCETCQRRLENNPLRLLDCKEEDCKLLASLAPKMKDFLDTDSKEFHEKVKEYLTELGIPFEEDPTLIRGQDYYTKTVFEIVPINEALGKGSLGGGGRYDGLVEVYGGNSTPASGFGMGFERIIAAMKAKDLGVQSKDTLHVFLIQLGDQAKKKSLRLLQDIRSHGIKIRGAFGKDSIKSQLRLASKLEAQYTLILGQIEVRDNVIILRDMQKGKQKTISLNDVTKELLELIDPTTLDNNDFSGEIVSLKELEERKKAFESMPE